MTLELPILTQELQSSPALALEGPTQHKALIVILPAHTLFMAPYYHQETVSLPSLAFKALPRQLLPTVLFQQLLVTLQNPAQKIHPSPWPVWLSWLSIIP